MSANADRVVIVGAGHAGGTLALQLRQQGWQGAITLIGAEAAEPYQRPPLSKAWLTGTAGLDTVRLRRPGLLGEEGVVVRTGTPVTAIDRAGRVVICADGGRVAYDVLVLATGIRPRALPVPGGDLAGVHTLRDLADADGLKAALQPGRRLVVIGAGYIGLEVASAARGLGVAVTVLEREDRVLARVASPELSAWFEALHRAHRVDFVFGAGVVALRGAAGRVQAVVLSDGQEIPADDVLVGIGGQVRMELADACGLACAGGGIVVDAACRTSDPAIRAIGDVTWRPLAFGGGVGRLESVQNALEQARIVAADLCGRPAPAPEVPWFWSDQYDAKLQIAGLADASDRHVMRPDPAGRGVAVFHLGPDDRLRAVEAVNRPADFMAGRQWIARGCPLSPARLADPSCPIRQAEAPVAVAF